MLMMIWYDDVAAAATAADDDHDEVDCIILYILKWLFVFVSLEPDLYFFHTTLHATGASVHIHDMDRLWEAVT